MSGQANLHLVDEKQWSAGLRLDEANARTRSHVIDRALQSGILVFTAAALWLVGDSGSAYTRWGFVLGLLGQPLYLAASWRARQWGMFLAAIVVTVVWLRGVINHFL